MKVRQQFMWFGGAVLVGLSGALVITNPDNEAYEEYATERIVLYLKEDGCREISQEAGAIVESLCKTAVDTIRPQIPQLISQQTKRQNYLLFSIYQTELSPPSPAPSYHFETVGILQTFYTYQAEEI